jgi:hypothetical protein
MGFPVQLRVDKFRTSLRNLHGPPGVERAPQGKGWRRNLTSAGTHRNDGFREVTSRKIIIIVRDKALRPSRQENAIKKSVLLWQ